MENITQPDHHPDTSDPLRQRDAWQQLSLTADQLAFESDFDSGEGQGERLVDQPQHASDASLWLTLLEYRERRDGLQGLLSVWRVFHARKRGMNVEGPDAQALLERFLKAAVNDSRILTEVWKYAVLMYSSSGALWPQLYQEVISHFIRLQQRENVLLWHRRLQPKFGFKSNKDFFQALIEPHVVDDRLVVQDILQSLYQASPHRRLYHLILTKLHDAGKDALARDWRKILLAEGEAPDGPQARHFLRYLQHYYQREPLLPVEVQLARHRNPEKKVHSEENIGQIFEAINRVHGEVFGIKEKDFNDGFGARMLATRWIPLNFVLQAFAAFGVREIGPLSLQTIALRSGSLNVLLHNLQQLDELGIGIGNSTYTRAIRHFAEKGQQGFLDDLIQSDIHPDAFDDLATTSRAFDPTSSPAARKVHRILLTSRLAVSSEPTLLAWNQLLIQAARSANAKELFRILDEMQIHDVAITPPALNALGDALYSISKRPPGTTASLNDYAGVCHRIITRRLIPPRKVLWAVLHVLGERFRLEAFETLALHILEQFKPAKSRTNSAGLLIHASYTPSQTSSHGDFFMPMPGGLPTKHDQHPIQLLFTRHLQERILHWGLHWALGGSQPASAPFRRYGGKGKPEDYYFARGIRVLALLREAGVTVRQTILRRTTRLLLAQLYGQSPILARRFQVIRRRNQLTLSEAKALCEAAWGHEYLDPIDVLREDIQHHKELIARAERLPARESREAT
jgi:hypothetical protein